jgi:hypothetical protein
MVARPLHRQGRKPIQNPNRGPDRLLVNLG